jgi:hypothetical protein
VSVLRRLVHNRRDLLIPWTAVIVGVKTGHLQGMGLFRPLKPLTGIGMITRPTVLLTADGAILCWCLPGILHGPWKQEVLNAAKCLTKPTPSTVVNGSNRAQKGKDWRVAEDNLPPPHVGTLEGVAKSLSPGFFNLARVSPFVSAILPRR